MAEVNRYSTIVTWAKLILPILGIVLLSSLFLLSRAPDPEAAIPFADVDVEQIARDQRLSQPRFAGTLEDGREITLVSSQAVPATDRQNVILLDTIEARVELSDRDFLLLNAENGAVDLAAQQADLDGDVRIVTSQGYRISSGSMQIALSEMHILAPTAVEGAGPGFTISAGAMELSGEDGAAVLSFTGGVRLLYEGGE